MSLSSIILHEMPPKSPKRHIERHIKLGNQKAFGMSW